MPQTPDLEPNASSLIRPIPHYLRPEFVHFLAERPTSALHEIKRGLEQTKPHAHRGKHHYIDMDMAAVEFVLGERRPTAERLVSARAAEEHAERVLRQQQELLDRAHAELEIARRVVCQLEELAVAEARRAEVAA